MKKILFFGIDLNKIWQKLQQSLKKKDKRKIIGRNKDKYTILECMKFCLLGGAFMYLLLAVFAFGVGLIVWLDPLIAFRTHLDMTGDSWNFAIISLKLFGVCELFCLMCCLFAGKPRSEVFIYEEDNKNNLRILRNKKNKLDDYDYYKQYYSDGTYKRRGPR